MTSKRKHWVSIQCESSTEVSWGKVRCLTHPLSVNESNSAFYYHHLYLLLSYYHLLLYHLPQNSSRLTKTQKRQHSMSVLWYCGNIHCKCCEKLIVFLFVVTQSEACGTIPVPFKGKPAWKRRHESALMIYYTQGTEQKVLGDRGGE